MLKGFVEAVRQYTDVQIGESPFLTAIEGLTIFAPIMRNAQATSSSNPLSASSFKGRNGLFSVTGDSITGQGKRW